MGYEMIFDYHTHTVYSHGRGTIEQNAAAAADKGLEEIAVTDHGPGHLTYGMKLKDVPRMRKDIEEAEAEYPVKIHLGVEANITEKGSGIDVAEADIPAFDFIIAGYHYGVTHGRCIANWICSHGMIRQPSLMVKNTDMTVRALYENDILILTHPGDKGPFDMRELARACAAAGTWMEISSRHRHLTVEEIRIAAEEDVSFVISSDAHIPADVGEFQGGVERALEAGLDMERVVNVRRIG